MNPNKLPCGLRGLSRHGGNVPESVCVASDFGRSEEEHGEGAVCEGDIAAGQS